MTSEELFRLHEHIASVLAERLMEEKSKLEKRLQQLRASDDLQVTSGRRAYPAVQPKFRNPDRPEETWTGRGKRPRWLDAKLKSGERIDKFRIAS